MQDLLSDAVQHDSLQKVLYYMAALSVTMSEDQGRTAPAAFSLPLFETLYFGYYSIYIELFRRDYNFHDGYIIGPDGDYFKI